MKFKRKTIAALTAVGLIAGLAGVAAADAPTGGSVAIDGSSADNAYTNTFAVNIDAVALHCPPGGDMKAMEVAFSNDGVDGPWTVVKAAEAAWPGADADGCDGATTTPASFGWTLAAGVDGNRTVFARFRHANDVISASDSIIVDRTAPVIADEGIESGTSGSNGWFTSAVVNEFSATDGTGSGITCSSPWTVSSGTNEGSAVTIPSGTCSDAAGNTAASIASSAYKIDLSNPTVTIVSPTDSATVNTATVTVSGTASDAVSGVAKVEIGAVTASGTENWSAPGVALDCGRNTIEAVVTDGAGRTGSHSISVMRSCSAPTTYSATFEQPLDGYGVLNKAKVGRVVPVKVNVTATTEGTAAEIAEGTVTLRSSLSACNAAAGSDTVEVYAAGSSTTGNQFRYDPEGEFWIYNLDTGKLPSAAANRCYTAQIELNGVAIPGAVVSLQLMK